MGMSNAPSSRKIVRWEKDCQFRSGNESPTEMLDNVRGSELQIRGELRGVCAKGKRADTHLQNDRQHTNWADERRHGGNSVPWVVRHCCEGKENFGRGVQGWRGGMKGNRHVNS